MIKVVLDANIFVSAVLKSHSSPARDFQLAEEGKVTLISSNDILSEVKAVLLYPKPLSSDRVSISTWDSNQQNQARQL